MALAAGIALAWYWLLSWASVGGMTDMEAMPGMAMAPAPWSADYLLPAFAMWALMMVAMMLPSAAPMILLHARIDRGTEAQRAFDSALFTFCYLLVWTVFSALAALAQATLVQAGLVSSATLELGPRWLTVTLLLVAAGWQLTSAKSACLEQCQAPLQFVVRYWRPGAAGAVRLGLRHGIFCLGCCWSLMLLLFPGGVMNLAWVALLAAVVFIEKLAPPSWRAERWIAAALAAGALGVAIA